MTACYSNLANVGELNSLYRPAHQSGLGYIYTLQDCVSNEIRYVGRTNGLLTRYQNHIKGQFRSQAMIDWLDSLSCLPRMNLLMTCAIGDVFIAEYVCYEHLTHAKLNLINRQRIVKNMNSKEIIRIRTELLRESQTKFAERIGKSLRQVQYYEAGVIDIPNHVDKLLELILRQEKNEGHR